MLLLCYVDNFTQAFCRMEGFEIGLFMVSNLDR